MSKAILYAVNTATQNLSVNDAISFGTTAQKCGTGLSVLAGNVFEKGPGYYTHNVTLNLTGAAAGNVVITMQRNGMQIPGAVATITTEAASNYVISIGFVTRESCCMDSQISAIVTGAEVVVETAAIVSERV